MANDGGHSVDTTPLWEAAQRLFIKEVGEADQGLVKAERATLQETISDLHKTQEKASRQYSDHSVHFGSANSSGTGTITLRLKSILDKLDLLFLRFSYLTKKLFSHSSKFSRTLSAKLGGKSYALEDALEETRTKLETLRETDQVNYQEETLRLLKAHSDDSMALTRLEEISRSAFQEIEFTAVSVRNIESEMYKGREEDRRAKVQKKFEDSLKWFERGRIAEIQTPFSQYRENVRKRHQDSCQWIFQDKDTPFTGWKASEAGFLWLVGRAGFGKSVLVSTIIERFDNEQLKQRTEHSPILLFFFCKRGDETATTACRILLHLCYQLLNHAKIEEDINLQEKYNESLNEVQRKFSTFVKIDPSQVDIPALHELFETLVKQQHRPIVLIVDALDECEDWDDSGFIKVLLALSNSTARIRVLVSSRQLGSELLQDVPLIEINNDRTQYDIALYVAKSVQSSRRNWDRTKAIRVIKGIEQNSPGSFKYAATKMESLKEPGLVESFDQFIKDLKPGMNSVYRQTFENLSKGQRHLLVVALRWLICGRDDIPIEYIADEVELNWDEESIECEDDLVTSDADSLDLASKVLDEIDFDQKNESDNRNSDHQATYDALEKVGRDFVKSFAIVVFKVKRILMWNF
ncbi:hypothetical protein DBV05_g7592 [Lasiodiplodia theobromae]|uniref:Nephrocystin 3-like N-terminal domain-containing protein n=1 Tax=Lasiodiplodia theobromae TaxID=45133 RepID=A0A5N5D8S7_9PEZI|nr:hypothetical protein DBV05_g7592 [Lasiodiplodia theobromae]